VATASTNRLLQQLVSESRDRIQMLDFLRRITLDVTNKLMIGVRIDDGQPQLLPASLCFARVCSFSSVKSISPTSVKKV